MAEVDGKLDEERDASTGDSPADAVGFVARLKQRLPSKLTNLFRSRRAIAIIAAAISLTVVGTWSVLKPPEATPSEQLQAALELLQDPLDQGSRQEAVVIAQRLRSSGADIPEFKKGPSYILGIATFRNAHQQNVAASENGFLRAIQYLREAERSALDSQYRPEYAFALGVSLHQVGSSEDAVPFLQEALESFPAGKIEASKRLSEIYLDRKNPAELRLAVKLTDSILDTPSLSALEKDRLYLQKAQIHLALNQNMLARQALSKVTNITSSSHGTIVFRAQTLMANAEMLASGDVISAVSPPASLLVRMMAEEKFHEAREVLDPVANVVRLDQTFPRQAMFLQGICAQRIAEIDVDNTSAGKYDAAINIYGRTVQNYRDSHEGVAASLRLADLLRASDRDEEALMAYKNALGTVKSPTRFRNRWISLTEFRTRVLNAWNTWTRQGAFQPAIKLSQMMSPLVPEAQALELQALANQRWADRLTRELPTTPKSQRTIKQQQIKVLSRESGTTYSKLAELVKSTAQYPDMLWASAEHYRKGHAFAKSLDHFTRFINLRPKSKLALAIVRRGQVLMDLDRFKEALDHFQRVVELYPTDTAAFTAQFEIANCHLELGDAKLAEQTWRNILSSNELTPAAEEWRRSLFSLSRLLFHSGIVIREKAEQKAKGATNKEFLDALTNAGSHWEESRRRVKEYLERYPNAENVNEARFLLAKALQESAQLPMHLLKDAEVENVRIELKRNMDALLNEARDEYRKLQTRLLKKEEDELLDSLGQRFLRDCYFEIGHTYFALGEYSKAIVAYNSAANRYSRDPQVLLAYMQMANCNDRIGDHGEALSMIVQAKVILKQLPDDVFHSGNTSLSKEEWGKWLDWARQLRRPPEERPRILSMGAKTP